MDPWTRGEGIVRGHIAQREERMLQTEQWRGLTRMNWLVCTGTRTGIVQSCCCLPRMGSVQLRMQAAHRERRMLLPQQERQLYDPPWGLVEN